MFLLAKLTKIVKVQTPCCLFPFAAFSPGGFFFGVNIGDGSYLLW